MSDVIHSVTTSFAINLKQIVLMNFYVETAVFYPNTLLFLSDVDSLSSEPEIYLM